MSHLNNHLTAADFHRIRRGTASAEEVAAVGAHVRECAACRALADERLAIGDSAAAFQSAFSLEHEEGGEVRTMPMRSIVGWSAAAAAAIGAMFFLMPRREVARPPAPAPPVVIAVPHPHPHPHPPRDAGWDALIAKTRATGVLPFPADIRELAAPDMFRGEPNPVDDHAMWPVATAIDDQHPELRWRAAEGARCTVVLTSGGKELARSELLATPHWRVPIALPRGQMVRWQVRVERGGATSIIPAPPAPPAIFRVISEKEHEEIARAKEETPGDHLLIGLLVARAGVVDEARRELRASQDPLASRLLEQLP
jgi:hypothetical protein